MHRYLKVVFLSVVTAVSVKGQSLLVARSTGASMRLDTRSGVRIANPSEIITYSPRWGFATNCSVVAGGVTLASSSKEGEIEWLPSTNGVYSLTHTAGNVKYAAKFSAPAVKPDGEYTEKQGDYTWYFVVSGGVATVQNWKVRYGVATEPKPSGDLTIPDTLGGCPVVCIANSSFDGCSELESVVIPESVTSIEQGAFMWCSRLRCVTIRSHSPVIGDFAFGGGALTDAYFYGDMPVFDEQTFPGPDVVLHVQNGAQGWDNAIHGMDVRFEELTATPPKRPEASCYYVSESGSDVADGRSAGAPLRTIQEAVNLAKTGDTVVVLPGTYESFVCKGKVIRIVSSDGPWATIIDGGWSNRCVTMDVGYVGRLYYQMNWNAPNAWACNRTTELSGFTLRNGDVSNVDLYGYQGEGAGAFGGNLTNCIVEGCSAWSGWGGGCRGSVLRDCSVMDCTASSYGGGAYNCFLDRCVINGNDSNDWGGGLCESRADNCLISDNHAAYVGGGAFMSVLRNCTVVDNLVTYSQGAGVADCEVVNSIIWNNRMKNGAIVDNWYLFNDVSPAMTYTCTTPLVPGVGNISSDPMLYSDCRLDPSSPCVDAGCELSDPSQFALDGGPRVIGGKINLGAYEALVEGCRIQSRVSQGCGTIFLECRWKSGVTDNALFASSNVAVPSGADVIVRAYPGIIGGSSVVQSDREFLGIFVDGERVEAGRVSDLYGKTCYDFAFKVTKDLTVIEARFKESGWFVSPTGRDENDGTSWAKAKRSISAAAELALPGDRVVVTNGVYGPVKYTRGYAVRIQSVEGPDKTFIDGGGNSSCASMSRGETVLAGFTLQNGSADHGGGLYDGIASNCVIRNCHAKYQGGGSDGGTLYDCLIENNEADSSGGGLYNGLACRCIIRGNSGGSTGGGLYFSSAYDSLVVDNEASTGGGGYASTFVNCTVVGNTANSGAGVYGYDGEESICRNCIVWDNYSGEWLDNGWAKFESSVTEPAFEEGVFSADPQFVDAENGDYRLQSTSPCVDAGNTAYAYGPIDLAGNARIVNGIVDIGAYEWDAGVRDGEYTEQVGAYTWFFVVKDGGAIVMQREGVAVMPNPTGRLEVPSELGGCPVVSVGDNAFRWCSGLTSVVLPDTVTNIGRFAFANCEGLAALPWSHGVEQINEGAFAYCRNLKLVEIPDGVTRIGAYAFADCVSLKRLVIGNGVETVPTGWDYALSYGVAGTNEQGEVYHNRVKGLPSLEYVEIHSVAALDLFYDGEFPAVREVVLGDEIDFLPRNFFWSFPNVERIVFSEDVTAVEEGAFAGCRALTEVTVPDAVTNIGAYAFADCVSLKRLVIGNGVETVPTGWDYALSYGVAGTNEQGEVYHNRVKGLPSLEYVEIHSVAALDLFCDGEFPAVREVVLGDEIEVVPEDFFYSFPNVEKVTARPGIGPVTDEGVVDVDGRRWQYEIAGGEARIISVEPAYGDVRVPDTIKGCPVAAIMPYGIMSAANVCLGVNVKRVWSHSFSTPGTTPTKISVADGNPYFVVENGLLYDAGKAHVYFCESDAQSVVLPSTVRSVDMDVFSQHFQLKSIVLPVGMESFGGVQCFNCSAIENVQFPTTFKMIDQSSFMWCRNLKEVALPNELQEISTQAFDRSGLCNVVIPDSVTNIGTSAFRSCESLTNVQVGASMKRIGMGAFSDCTNLFSIVFGGDAPSVEYDAFKGVPESCVAKVNYDSEGWGVDIPGIWNGLHIEYEDPPVLTMEALSASVAENSHSGVSVRISRTGSTRKPLCVVLEVSTVWLHVPMQVLIPAGSASTIFTVRPKDNPVADGNRSAEIVARAVGCESGSCEIEIVDDEVPSLSLAFSTDTLKEGGSEIIVTVTRDLVTDEPLTVYLTGTTANRCSCPKSVTIPAGAASVTFKIEAANDDVARIAAEMTLRASAAGYGSASKTFTVEDDDIPGVTLTLTPDAAQEGGSVRATVARVDEDDLSKAITVKLSASDPQEIASMPSSVTIPAGKVSVDFNVYLADDGRDNGDRDVVLQGAILIESCGCSGQPSSGDAIEAVLTIIDNDGPTLSLSVSPATMREGLDEAGFLTISHNSVLDEDLTVRISYDLESEIEVVGEAIIRAGEKSVTVPVKTLNDGVEDGSRLVTIAVEDAAGVFAPDTKWLMVTDQNLPDFSAEVDGSVSSVEAGGTFDCRLTIHNSGFADCGRAIPYAVYLLPESERDVTKGVLVSSGSIDGGLAQDALEVRTVANVVAPSNVGHYRLGLVVDPNATITELDEANNTAWSNGFHVGPAYSARASVDGELFERGAQVAISGNATRIAGGEPAANVDVDVYVVCDGIRTTLRTKTDAAGQFTVTYQPTSGVCGHCIVGACYPGEGLEEEQDAFDILGLKAATTSALVWDIALGDENTKMLSVRNPTGVELTGFAIGSGNLPKGCELTLTAPAKLGAGATQTFRITAKGTDLTDGVNYEPFEIVLTTAEGATLTHKAYFHCQSQKAYLRARPTSIDTTMTIGRVRTVEVEIYNDGKGDSGAVSVNFKCPDWLRIVGGNIGNLASNESAVLTFELTPTAAHGLNLNAVYSGTVGINCENGTGLALPVKFTPVSEEFGSVKVDAIDDNTYHLEGKPHLANAVVKVTNPYTQKVVAMGRTDVQGLWSATDIPEGKYQLTVTANNHDTYADELLIEPGRTASVTAFLQYQSVRVSWDVTEVEITDEYDVELTLVYETNVPQPTILTHVDTGLPNKKELPVLEEGEQRMFTITLENVGLIAAKRVTLTMPTIEGYTFTLADNDVMVPAKSSVEIPVLFSRPAKRKMLKTAALKATVVNEEIVPCKPRMSTKTYWDCGVERSYEYPTEFTHNSGLCKKVTYITEPQPPAENVPTRGGGAGGGYGGGGIGGGTGTTWKKTSCEPCVNSIADAMVDCGLDESVAAAFQRQYDLLLAGRIVVPQGYSGVSMFGDGDQFVELPNSVKSEAYDMSRLANEVYNDKTQGYDIPEAFRYEPLEYDEVIKIIKSDGQFSCREEEYRNFMWGKRPMTMIYSKVPTGFQATIFKSLDSGSLVLAFRGTEFEFSYNGVEDIVVDVDNAVCFQTSQYILARDLLADILKARSEDIVVAGHSLGGGLTQYAMAKNSIVGRSVKGYTFNPAGQCMFKLFLVSESARKAAGAIVNVRNDGDPVSWYGRHIGSIFELPCESNHHSITAVIDGIKRMSAIEGRSDWQYRKQAYIKLIEMCYGGRLRETAKDCLERITSICDHSTRPIDMKESYQEAVGGEICTPDFNTGIKGVDLSQKDLWILRVLDYATKDMTRVWFGDDLLRVASPDQIDVIVSKMVDSYSANDVVDESALDYLFDDVVIKELLHKQIKFINRTFANVAQNNYDVPIDFDSLKQSCAALATCYSYICDMRLGTPADGEYDEDDIKGVSGSRDVAEYLKNAMDRIRVAIDSNADSVCASVTLQINQTVAMTRTAFDGTLTLFNGHSSVPITDVKFEPSVLDENGNERKDLFKLLVNDEEIASVGGSKLIVGADIAASDSGSTVVRFVPTHDAAPTEPKVYRFGGTVTYTDPFTGQTATVELTSVSLTVEPSPYLKLDYFVQRDVFSDDPDTDEIEPSIPAEIAVRVRNVGTGEAKGVTIDSAQPVMTDNEKGLAIDFKLSDFDLSGSYVDGKEAHLGLLSTVNLGTIDAGESKVAQWWLTSSLQGHFVDMKAICTPRNKWNTPDTSLVDTEHVDVHKLVRSVSVDDDDLPDFLVCDEKDLYGLPNEVYPAVGEPLSVRRDAKVTVSGTLAGLSPVLSVSMTASAGWNYVYVPVAGVSGYDVTEVECEGADMPSRNVWTTDRVFKDAGKPLVEDRLHLLVYFAESATKTISVRLSGNATNGPKVEAFEGVTDGALEYAVRDSLAVVFDREIDPATFGADDLQLIRQGEYVGDLSGVAVRAADASNRRFEISGLSGVCAEKGRYELVVQCAGIRSADGLLGSVGRSVSWMLGSSGVADSFVVTREVGVAGNVFTIAFNNPSIKLTAGHLTLTKNGAPVELPPTVIITDKGLGVYEVTGLDALLAGEGTYSLSCDVCAGEAATWSDDLTPPDPATGIRIAPDEGISDTDGITCVRELTVTGVLSEDNVSVAVFCRYANNVETKLADATVAGRSFTASVTLPSDGNATLIVRSADAAGNSADASVDVFVDAIPLTVTFGGIPEEGVVAEAIGLSFSDEIMESDIGLDCFELTRDGKTVSLPGMVFYGTDKRHFGIEGLEEVCNVDGTYVLTFASEDVRKRSSGLKKPIRSSVTWSYKCPDREHPTTGEVAIDGAGVDAAYEWGIDRVEIPFSEPVNVPELIANGLIAVAVRTDFDFIPSWNAANNVLSLAVLDEKLPRGAGKVVLDPALIKDLAGNELNCSDTTASGTDRFASSLQLTKVDSYAMPTWYGGRLAVGYKATAGEGIAKLGDEVVVSGITGSGCQGVSVCWADWDGDGVDELFVGEANGRVTLRVGATVTEIRSGGESTFGSTRAVLCAFDADGDGINESVVCGGVDGKFRRMWKTEDGSTGFEWLADAHGMPIVVAGGRSAPAFADVNHDGRIDLLTGDAKGNVWLYYGTDRAWISTPVCLIDNSKGRLSDRSRVAYGDVNADGLGDLIVGLSDGSVVALLGERRPAPAITYEIVWPITLGESVNAAQLAWEVGGASVWTPEWWDDADDGEHCAFIRNVGNNTNAWMRTTVDGPGEITFAWMCDLTSRNTKLQFFVDDVAQGVVSGLTPWTPVSVSVYGEGAHTLKWRLFTGRSGAAETDVGAVDAVAWTPAVPPTLAEALNTNLEWRTEGVVVWHGVAKDAKLATRDAWAVVTGLGDEAVSAVETQVYGNGLLMFDWAVSCEEEYDWLEVSVDGNVYTYITGDVDWLTDGVEIEGEGWHTVRWSYCKDEMDDPEMIGDNIAMLDNVVWLSEDVPPEEPQEPEKTATENTPVPVPYSIFESASFKVYLDAASGDYESAAMAIGKNGCPIWESFVAGLDPEKPDSKFTAKIEIVNGKPVVTWEPALNGTNDDGTCIKEGVRVYELKGSINLKDWSTVPKDGEAAFNFFKVEVKLPVP